MYNGHDYLSCIKPAAKQTATKSDAQKFEQIEAMGFTTTRHNLISTADKVFGEGKWNHTVISQTLDYVDTIGAKCCVGCVSFVKVELENGNFHEDIGYYSAEESTKGLSIYNARIGSATSALKTVLLSFGDKFKRELEQLQKQTNPEQSSTKQKNIQSLDKSLDKQIQEKPNVLVRVSLSHVPEIEHESLENKNIVPTVNVNNVTTELNSLLPTKDKTSETIAQSTSNQKKEERVLQINDSVTKNEKKLKLNQVEMQRLERKRKQLEKQLEFKRRMLEKEGQIFSSNNKPNPKY